ncbi:MAG: CHAT domain-containing protein [Thermodesulfobacteriota bacterium]
MRFSLWLTVLFALVLNLSGCMKAAEKITAAPPEERGEKAGPPLPDAAAVPGVYQERRQEPDADDWSIPLILAASAGRYEREGDETKALHMLDRAAEAFAARGEAAGEAMVIGRKFILLMHAGREREALALLGEGREKWPQPLRAFPNFLRGRHALLRGDFAEARTNLHRSLQENADYRKDPFLLALRRDTELAAGMTAVLSDRLPRLQAVYRRPDRESGMSPAGGSGAHLKDALALNRELKQTKIGPLIPPADFQRAEAAAFTFMGLEEGMRGDSTISFLYLHYAGDLARAAGDRLGEMWSLLFLGELGLGTEGRAEGLRAAGRLREMADFCQAAPYRVWARLLQARYVLELGRRDEAIASLREAEAILSVRMPGPEPEMLTGIFRIQRRAVYDYLVDLLAAEGRVGEALTAAEKAKALMTADLLNGRRIGGTPLERDLLEREARLQEKGALLRRRILHLSGDRPTGELIGRLRDNDEAHRALLARIGKEAERLLPFLQVRGIDPAALQGFLDEDTTLFAYFVTDRGLYTWAIHRNVIHLERIDLPRTELRRFVLDCLEAIRTRNRRRTESLTRRAYDLLLKRVIPFVSGERIGFIPDDCLIYFPFAAMNYRGKAIVEGFSIFQIPTAGMLERAVTERTQPGMRLLAIGDPHPADGTPDLRHAGEELKAVRKRGGPTTVLQHGHASGANVRKRMADVDIVHFAVRGRFDPGDPLRSGLLLSPDTGPDGALNALEVFGLRYQGRLVVLSGCDTRPAADPEGRSYSVLLRAFHHAGSPSVISTLWLVDDRSAARLLEILYRQVDRRRTLSDSLRAAQRQMVREGVPPHVWAAFVLSGRY